LLTGLLQREANVGIGPLEYAIGQACQPPVRQYRTGESVVAFAIAANYSPMRNFRFAEVV
jgi:hypothetical protein